MDLSAWRAQLDHRIAHLKSEGGGGGGKAEQKSGSGETKKRATIEGSNQSSSRPPSQHGSPPPRHGSSRRDQPKVNEGSTPNGGGTPPRDEAVVRRSERGKSTRQKAEGSQRRSRQGQEEVNISDLHKWKQDMQQKAAALAGSAGREDVSLPPARDPTLYDSTIAKIKAGGEMQVQRRIRRSRTTSGRSSALLRHRRAEEGESKVVERGEKVDGREENNKGGMQKHERDGRGSGSAEDNKSRRDVDPLFNPNPLPAALPTSPRHSITSVTSFAPNASGVGGMTLRRSKYYRDASSVHATLGEGEEVGESREDGNEGKEMMLGVFDGREASPRQYISAHQYMSTTSLPHLPIDGDEERAVEGNGTASGGEVLFHLDKRGERGGEKVRRMSDGGVVGGSAAGEVGHVSVEQQRRANEGGLNRAEGRGRVESDRFVHILSPSPFISGDEEVGHEGVELKKVAPTPPRSPPPPLSSQVRAEEVRAKGERQAERRRETDLSNTANSLTYSGTLTGSGAFRGVEKRGGGGEGEETNGGRSSSSRIPNIHVSGGYPDVRRAGSEACSRDSPPLNNEIDLLRVSPSRPRRQKKGGKRGGDKGGGSEEREKEALSHSPTPAESPSYLPPIQSLASDASPPSPLPPPRPSSLNMHDSMTLVEEGKGWRKAEKQGGMAEDRAFTSTASFPITEPAEGRGQGAGVWRWRGKSHHNKDKGEDGKGEEEERENEEGVEERKDGHKKKGSRDGSSGERKRELGSMPAKSSEKKRGVERGDVEDGQEEEEEEEGGGRRRGDSDRSMQSRLVTEDVDISDASSFEVGKWETNTVKNTTPLKKSGPPLDSLHLSLSKIGGGSNHRSDNMVGGGGGVKKEGTWMGGGESDGGEGSAELASSIGGHPPSPSLSLIAQQSVTEDVRRSPVDEIPGAVNMGAMSPIVSGGGKGSRGEGGGTIPAVVVDGMEGVRSCMACHGK